MVQVYIGLNDKRTRVQEISTSAAAEYIARIAADSIGGATISKAQGVYKHDDGGIVTEETIRLELLEDSNEARQMAARICYEFNQESVLYSTPAGAVFITDSAAYI